MKRYIIISTLVHLLCFYVISLRVQYENSNNAQGVAEQTTVEIVEAKKENAKDSGSGRDVRVIELNQAGQGESKVLKDYYWGVGISGEYLTLGTGLQVYRVSTVYGGYSADSAGILPGDLIYSVNGGDLLNNDISGDGPLHLILGIYRGTQIIFINLDRTKVYY